MPRRRPPTSRLHRKPCKPSSKKNANRCCSSSPRHSRKRKGSAPMLTEELHRTYKGRDPNEVSRALQELTPRSCVIVDRRNRPVLLSSAGYVLRFGNAYRLQIRAPFRHEDIQAVRII